MHTVALFFFANVLFCLAYMVRDMAYLRAITILAACSTLPYFYFQAVPLYSAMGWQVAFIVINSFNLIVLLLHRRPIKLDEQEQWLHESTLRFLKPRKMRRLLRLAKTHDIKKGEVLIMKDQEPLAVRFTRVSADEIRITNAERVALDGQALMADPTLRSVMLLLGYEQIGDEVPVSLDAMLIRPAS
ncbi:hypothetical protein [Halomonas chromatireducens]|uniref:POPDC1-3 domain-containing protein n=1 Tax=Halomonas chromatireducens TaxID=507626 RepID=A0A120JW90_9GAMM|nr:hypothetical protein [Halomonas chromatireducens]AMD01511.1 hypothetical protein LOKO_02451 [Halomonas chromatireducens]